MLFKLISNDTQAIVINNEYLTIGPLSSIIYKHLLSDEDTCPTPDTNNLTII